MNIQTTDVQPLSRVERISSLIFFRDLVLAQFILYKLKLDLSDAMFLTGLSIFSAFSHILVIKYRTFALQK